MRPLFRLVDIPLRNDNRGSLVFAQECEQIPFPVKRLFALYGIAPGATRGGHAHRQQHQFLMMMQGSCTIAVNDGKTRQNITLEGPQRALYVPPGLWLDLFDFSPDAICAVLASGPYDEADYIRDFATFSTFTAGANQ